MNENFTIEIREIDSIRPYENNPRINEKAVEPVAKSIQEFGFRQPIVVDADGIIIAGHTRFLAAKKLGLQKVPVHVATELTPEQVKAYRLADNKTGEIAEWDMNILPIEIAALQASGFNMDSLGFTEKSLLQLLATDLTQGNTDPDMVPEPPDAATTQRGDLWILGEHRLLCGDSAKQEDVDYLLNGNIIELVNIDPPYNVKVEPRSNNAILAGVSSFALPESKGETKRDHERSERKALDKQGLHHSAMKLATQPDMAPTTRKMRAKDRPLVNDFVSDDEFDRLLDGWFGNVARSLKPGHGFYIWGGYANIQNYPPMLKKHGLYFSQCIVWNKCHPVLTRKDFMGAHEICFYGWKEGAAHRFFGPNNVSDLWEVKKVPPQQMQHLTEKPVELAVRAIQYSSKPGENVLELFGGSGSTLIACEQTGRKCFAMELDELYCDTIVKRYEEFTGKKAKRIPASDHSTSNDTTGKASPAGAE